MGCGGSRPPSGDTGYPSATSAEDISIEDVPQPKAVATAAEKAATSIEGMPEPAVATATKTADPASADVSGQLTATRKETNLAPAAPAGAETIEVSLSSTSTSMPLPSVLGSQAQALPRAPAEDMGEGVSGSGSTAGGKDRPHGKGVMERIASFSAPRSSLASNPASPPPPPNATIESAAAVAAWKAFVDAAEIAPGLQAYEALRSLYGIPPKARGLEAFELLMERGTRDQGPGTPSMPARVKETIKVLCRQKQRRASITASRPPAVNSKGEPVPPLMVVVSGAGPVGLRCALECQLLGLAVTVVELRLTFSRVNILTLWPQTAEDLMGFGAKLFYPRFTNHGDLLHLGTREIQLVLFKAALLLGVRFVHGAELVAVQARMYTCNTCNTCNTCAYTYTCAYTCTYTYTYTYGACGRPGTHVYM